MKRNTDALTKFNNLKVRLGIKRYEAAGVLELMWHLTARETPQGDIGKRSDQDIATYLEWSGNPSVLIQGLVETHWIDHHPVHRLIVHAWPEHCEDSIHMALARKIMLFADGTIPNLKRFSKEDRAELMPALMALKNDDSTRFLSEVRKSTPLLDQSSVRIPSESVRTDTTFVRTESVRTALPCPALPEPCQAKPLPEPLPNAQTATASGLKEAERKNGNNRNGNSQPGPATEDVIWACFKTALLDFGIEPVDIESIITKAKSLFTEFKSTPNRDIICDTMAIAFKAKRDTAVKSIPAYVCSWLILSIQKKKPKYEPSDYFIKLARTHFDRLRGEAT